MSEVETFKCRCGLRLRIFSCGWRPVLGFNEIRGGEAKRGGEMFVVAGILSTVPAHESMRFRVLRNESMP
jgi:hypothetical protein